jgi:hypothetical protein
MHESKPFPKPPRAGERDVVIQIPARFVKRDGENPLGGHYLFPWGEQRIISG